MVKASMIGGLVAAVSVIVNVAGLVLARKGKPTASLAICAVTVLCMIAVAIAYKPA